MKKLYREFPKYDDARRARIARLALRARNSVRAALCLFAATLAFVFSASVSAQSLPGALPTAPTASNEKPTFWLLDENGSWRVPLPNWSLEDVTRMIDAREEKSALPPYSIQNVSARGAVADGVARLTIEFTVNAADGLIRVPLGLQEGAYIPTAEEIASGESRNGGFSYTGPGSCALDVDPKTGEYVAVLRSFRRRPRAENDRVNEPKKDSTAPENAPEPDVKNADEPTNAETVPVESTPENVTPNVEEQTAAPTEEQLAPSEETQDAPAPIAENAPENTTEANADASAQDAAPQEQAEGTQEAAPNAAATIARLFSRYAEVVENENYDELEEGAEALLEESGTARIRPHQYVITLKLSFVVESAGTDEYRFVATFPTSAHSELSLTCPIAEVLISAVKGAIATPPTGLTETSSELNLRGLARGGERTELVWQKVEKKAEETRRAYQVEKAAISATLSSRETTYEATLPIRVFNGDSDVFYVRLPENASLVADSVVASGSNSMYSATATETTEPELEEFGSETIQGKFAEVRLSQKTSMVTLKLRARVPVETADAENGASAVRDIAGFEVLGAQKQTGQIRIAKSEELDFDITPGVGATYGADLTLGEGEEAYAFYAQPFTLTARAFKRQTIVNVKPEYILAIGSDALLRARLRYSVYGGKAVGFKIRLNGWTVQDVEGSESIDTRNFVPNSANDELTCPLKRPADGEFVLDMTLTRSVDVDDKNVFTTKLPLPIADWVEPAPVVVVPEDNIELTPIKKRCVGLEAKTSRAFSLELEPHKTTQTPLYYQARQALATSAENRRQSTFTSYVKRLTRSVECSAETEATINERGEFHVRQTFTYDVKYEPLDSLELRVPNKLLDAKSMRNATNLKYFIDGKPAPSQNLRMEELSGKDYRLCHILLGDAPKIGTCVVSVQYDCPTVEFKDKSTKLIELYLTQPHTRADQASDDSDADEGVSEERFMGNELRFNVPSGVFLSYVKNDQAFWTLEQDGVTADGLTRYHNYRSNMPETQIRFEAVGDRQRVTCVERAWIQSWFGLNKRVDRIAYRMTTGYDVVKIKLPEGVKREQVAVVVDGAALRDVADRERGLFDEDMTLNIPISKELQQREFVLELSYAAPLAETNRGRCLAYFPTFLDVAWVRRAYWQIVEPGDRSIVVSPKNWTSEYIVSRVSSLGLYRRVASISSDELAKWVGVDRRDPMPPEAHIYLFSSFEQPQRSDFYTMSTMTLVFLGSGIALLVGLGLIYFPSMRSPVFLIFLSVTATGASIVQPTLALLFLQTTALGIFLTLATLVVALTFGRDKSRAAASRALGAVRDEPVKKRVVETRVNGDEA